MVATRPSTREPVWSAFTALTQPLWWISLGVLLVNDHCLKGAGVLAPLLTGKLSDFSGLLMAPVLLAALLSPRSRRGFLLAHLAVGASFAALKLSPASAAAFCRMAGLCGLSLKVVCDPSDLAALPMLGVSYWLFGSRL